MFACRLHGFPNASPLLFLDPMALQFWKPGTAAPGSSLDRASETEGNLVQSAPIAAVGGIQGQRERLPIFKHRKHNAHSFIRI